MGYAPESLPLQIQLDRPRYIPELAVDLADVGGVVYTAAPAFIVGCGLVSGVGSDVLARGGAGWGYIPPRVSAPQFFTGPVAGVAAGFGCGFGPVRTWQLSAAAGAVLWAGRTMSGGAGFGWDLLPARSYCAALNLEVAGAVFRRVDGYGVARVAVQYLGQRAAGWWGVDLFGDRPDSYQERDAELLYSLSLAIDLDEPGYIPRKSFGWLLDNYTGRAPVVRSSAAQLGVRQPPAQDDAVRLPWGVGESRFYSPDLPYIVEQPAVEIPPAPDADLKEVYITVNSVSVYALPGLEPLPLADIRLDLDLDSHSWRIKADVLSDGAMALLRPDESGKRELQLEINGHVWRFFIASWERSRAVSGGDLQRRWAVSGYSRTQYLGSGYAPQRTRSIGTTTAVQAAEDELAGSGFTLTWPTSGAGALPDWSIPSSIYSYQELTPLGAIRKLLDAVGGVIVPAMAADAFTVQPRYKVAPWLLNTISPDKTIHEAQVLSEGGQHESGARINAVFVSGERAGVGLSVVRAGTAGDVPGADVVDPWLTAQEANQARGVHELAASGDKIRHTLELALPESAAQPGLVLPGQIVEVQHYDSTQDYRAYVVGVSVSVPGRGLAKVRQTVTLEEAVAWQS